MPTATTYLGIAIVTHNNELDLPGCLDALLENAPDAYVVIRDCNSADRTFEIAKQHPAVSKVMSGPNVGFGTGCNDAVRAIERPVRALLILNPDTRVDFKLEDLLEYVERFGKFGCVGVRQQSFDGRLVWSWDQFPSPKLEWKKARKSSLLQRSQAGYTQDRHVDWTMGAFLLIPRLAFDSIGGFDEQFFMFCEETDLCNRLADRGLPTYYVNQFHFSHDRSDKASLWREVLRINSRRKYDKKWLSRKDTLLCQIAHSYRWAHDLVHPDRPRDRKLALPRLLATWNLIQASTPPPSTRANLDSWQSVRPFWSGHRGDN